MQILCKGNPKGLQSVYRNGRLPLHTAIMHKQTEVATYLLGKYPDGSKEKDKYESLPIHKALRDGEDKIANLLLDTYPNAAEEKEGTGKTCIFWLPLTYIHRI